MTQPPLFTQKKQTTLGNYEQNDIISEAIAKFRMTLLFHGVDIGAKRKFELVNQGYMSDETSYRSQSSLYNQQFKSFQNDADSDNYYKQFFQETSLNEDAIGDLTETVSSSWGRKYQFTVVTKEMWQLEGGNTEYEPDFWNWINLLNEGWQHYVDYEKFYLYRKQAEDWLKMDVIGLNKELSQDAQIAYVRLELQRIRDNSLYALNKFLWMKEPLAKSPKGEKYNAWLCQAFILYLYDLVINSIIGKSRQIGFTTTLVGAGTVTSMTRKNNLIKFVAQKGKKAEEIFRDKAKYCVDEYPDYLTPSIISDNRAFIEFNKKIGKGKSDGANSMFLIEPPSSDCINGGSPAKVLLDEIGLIDILNDIIGQGRPALYRTDPITLELKLQRHLMAWGTGGNMESGGAAFEQEYRSAKEAWLDRDFSYGLVPIFLNYFAKPGASSRHYETEKRFYYGKKVKAGKTDPKLIFHQSYPILEDDMFLLSSETIIPTIAITRNIERVNAKIKTSKGSGRFVRGHFVPIYDTAQPYDDGFDIPFKAIGAKFIHATDSEIYLGNDALSCVTIAYHPEDWKHRYAQGTDPIFTASGNSNFASTVWDRLHNRPTAWVNGNTEDYRYMYLQSHLMNLYYGLIGDNNMSTGIPELVENNVGGEYINYRSDRGYRHTLIPKWHLPDILQAGENEIGIRKVAKNSPFLINELEEMLVLYSDNIDCIDFWVQLKTFVRKKSVRHITYEPQNKEYHRDDILDSTNFSKIAAETIKMKPISLADIELSAKKKGKFKYVMDRNYNLKLVKV